MGAGPANSGQPAAQFFFILLDYSLVGNVYYYSSALMPAAHLKAGFLLVYIFDSDYFASAYQIINITKYQDVHFCSISKRMLHLGSV